MNPASNRYCPFPCRSIWPLLHTLLLLSASVHFLVRCQGEAAAQERAKTELARPEITKLGTIECDLVEATPVVFKDELYRFEYVRARYRHNKLGQPYFRFIHVGTGRVTPPFARGYELGSAYAEADKMYAYGVKGWGTDTIYVFWSKDLRHWSSTIALKLPGWAIYNTSVCKGKDRYLMAFEVGRPAEVVGRPFTNRFAASDDLIRWQLLPEPHVFTKDRYSACPSIRYLDGYFYMFYLEAQPGPTYETHLVRSPDLVHWESSPLNPVLRHSPEDRRIANPRLSPAERKRIATATNINNSDFDLCEYEGKVVIYYSWGNQHGVEHLAEAVYHGTLKQFLKGFFPCADGSRKLPQALRKGPP